METDETPDVTLDESEEPADEPAEEDFILSDDPTKLCRTICGICLKSCSCLRVHLRRSHQMSQSEHRKSFPTTEYEQKTHHRYDISDLVNQCLSRSRPCRVFFLCVFLAGDGIKLMVQLSNFKQLLFKKF